MGMSTHVVGFRPPDEKWQLMKDVYDACIAADAEVPAEVWEFFGHEEPDDAGIEVKLDLEKYGGNGREGYDVILSKLPASIDRIRFYNSW